MSCYRPLKALRQEDDGSVIIIKYKDRFSSDYHNDNQRYFDGYGDDFLLFRCGGCVGCLLDRALSWSVRCEHEASFHEENYFITLTFSDKYLPVDFSIRSWHLQDFWKRTRHALDEEASFFDGAFSSVPRIKYYAAGEYGDENFRPHYHASVFGLPLRKLGDLTYHAKSKDFTLYRSSFLERLWPWGFVSVGEFSFETAGYVARYPLTKALKGGRADYAEVGLEPERSWISKGIGRSWYEAYKAETWRDDYIVNSRGHTMAVPRTYLRWLEQVEDEQAWAIKAARVPDFFKKQKTIDDLASGRHHIAKLVKEASLTAGRLDRSR